MFSVALDKMSRTAFFSLYNHPPSTLLTLKETHTHLYTLSVGVVSPKTSWESDL